MCGGTATEFWLHRWKGAALDWDSGTACSGSHPWNQSCKNNHFCSFQKKNPLCFAVAGEVRTDERVLPVVPTNDPVWVEHRNELEDKHVSQRVSTRVISSEDEVEESVKHEGRGRLPRVHTTAEKKHLDPRVKITKTTVGIKPNKVRWS